MTVSQPLLTSIMSFTAFDLCGGNPSQIRMNRPSCSYFFFISSNTQRIVSVLTLPCFTQARFPVHLSSEFHVIMPRSVRCFQPPAEFGIGFSPFLPQVVRTYDLSVAPLGARKG